MKEKRTHHCFTKARFAAWNDWRKGNLNGPVHHVLVLFGLANSPTFELFYLFRD